jgi:ribosomal protein S18 acetylase RimI-like enzyme
MIRLAMAQEADTIRDIVDAAYRDYIPRIGKPPGPMLDDYVRRVAKGEAWVLEDAGRIVGILVLEQTDESFLLDNVAVAPHAQGGGYGRMLIAFAEAEGRRRGYREIRLYTHALMTENQALYRRLGFAETGRITEKGFDRVYMTKQLA